MWTVAPVVRPALRSGDLATRRRFGAGHGTLGALSFWALLFLSSPARPEPPSLEARRLEAAGDTIRAEGRVRLRSGDCRLEASALELGRGVAGEQVCLEAGTTNRLRLKAYRLKLDPGGRLEARYLRGELCACPGARSLVGFSALRARTGSDGARLHLTWPTLRILDVPVLRLPYWAIPLRPGVSGLLTPVIAYSGRDGLRLEQGVYLAPTPRSDILVAGGWIQSRGGVLRGRIRMWGHGGQQAEMSGVMLIQPEGARGAVRGKIGLRGRGWAAGATPDWVSDAQLPADMERAAQRVFAPDLRSRVWAWAGRGGMYGAVVGDLYQELGAGRPRERGTLGVIGVQVGLAPAPIAGPIFLLFDAALTHDLPGSAAVGGTDISVSPGLGLAWALGPARLSARAVHASRLSWITAADGPESREPFSGFQVGLLELETSVPLARVFSGDGGRRTRHLVEPVAGVSWSLASGEPVLAPGVELRDGALAVAGLRTRVWQRTGDRPIRRILEAAALVELELNPAPGQRHRRLVGGTASLSPVPAVRISGDLSWDLEREKLAQLQGQVCAHGLGFAACGGYSRFDLVRAGQLFRSEPGAWLPHGSLLFPLQLSADQVHGELRGRWRWLSLEVMVAGDPVRGAVTHARWALGLDLGCGCYQLGLGGSARTGQRWPDVMARLTLFSGHRRGCGAMNL